MKYVLFLLIVAGSLVSCSNANNEKTADGADSAQPESTAPASSRAALLTALKDLHTTLATNDKNKIAELFTFPLTDSIMPIFLDDSVFSKKYVAAGDQLTKQLFFEYYDTIVKFTDLDHIGELFKYLPVESLGNSDEMEKNIGAKTEPCLRQYRIEVEGDRVRLITGTLENADYKAQKLSASEDTSAGCEYSAVWMFRLEGNKLKFERYAAAG